MRTIKQFDPMEFQNKNQGFFVSFHVLSVDFFCEYTERISILYDVESD